MLERIPTNRVCIGLHVYLKDIPWFKHPFFRSNFLVTRQTEVQDIQAIGCEYVYYDPEKSKNSPLTKDVVAPPAKPAPEKIVTKKTKASELRKRKDAFIKSAQSFQTTAKEANRIMQGIVNGQTAFCEEALAMSRNFADVFLSDVQTAINLINLSGMDDELLYYHSLNVLILSCMLGREIGISDYEMKTLAFGALMHDIGKSKIPKRVLYKKDQHTRPELELIGLHPLYGVGILSAMQSVKKESMKIVYHHHVLRNGAGYPKGVAYEKTGLLARIVCVVDAYDNLINNRHKERVHTPYQALSILFRKAPKHYDEMVMAHFIKMMGVYPPGTICLLSSGELALVVSMGASALLPEVILYDPNVPKNEAMVLRLGTDIDAKISKVISFKELTTDQIRYLSLKEKIGYFAEKRES